VIVLDESPRPGGSIWRTTGAVSRSAAPWLARLAGSGAAVLNSATVVDAPGPHRLLVERAGKAAVVDYERLVLATGARELFLPFPGWTLPGVIGAGGAQALLKAGASFAGARVVVAGSGPLLLAVAAALRGAGARVAGIAEQAPLARLAGFAASLVGRPGRVGEAIGYGARLLGVPYLAGAWVLEASGAGAVERVVVTDGRREREWRCDTLACGFGLVASLELPRLLGCGTADGLVEVDGLQRTSAPDVYAAGELTAIGGSAHAVATGAIAGLAAAGRPVPPALLGARERERAFASRLARAFRLRRELLHLARPETILCRCEDVTMGAIDAALSLAPAGAAASRCARLHARAGMGACQGRVCGAALGFLRGGAAFTIRPPLVPAPLAVLAGDDAGVSAPGTAGPPAREERP
jgi:NADPH-dependent 2,4-dienoyl-CoA reductase/sulfur reductase-like enzyme